MIDSENTEEAGKAKGRAGGWALGIVLALVIYVLSTGPVAVLVYQMHGPGPLPAGFLTAYQPVMWTLQFFPRAVELMDLYLKWWFALFEISPASGHP
jgi:hypothetical protein